MTHPTELVDGVTRWTDAEGRVWVMTYLLGIPAAIPRGIVLVHNHVKPTSCLGMNGFRAWLQKPDPSRLVKCDCPWASELGGHYRVAALVPEARKAGGR